MSLKSSVIRQFGKPSGLIGGLAGFLMARRTSNKIRNKRTVELMELQANSRTLEFGCGPGLALAQCCEVVTEGRVVGLDHSEVMINQAKKRLEKAGLSTCVELLVGGTEYLAGMQSSFDRIYSLNVIQFIDDKSGYYRKVLDCLDKGGRCFTTYQPRLEKAGANGAEQMADEIENLMASVGFQFVTRVRIDAGGPQALCVFGEKPS